ncbi:glycolate oxidase subunit GlcF [Sulfuriflexus mobilis]|uniref:glycolate oxidase subunit GlcF n=1 Tax=Sulfuriflexus mobilis TaxID=1811807 RepID=UPI000F81E419|nr:glycolate oxidase subunit GlcF [Sulfuriflexus mobilis]
MQTTLHKSIKDTPDGQRADQILRSCVHCGFCNATCPTYQLLGDELEGPRGRIYLIKQLLETAHSGTHTRQHLDHCLTCRNCETTCPSGVEYHSLLEIGRRISEQHAPRNPASRLLRKLLRQILPHRRRMRALIRLAIYLRPLMPRQYRRQIPEAEIAAYQTDTQHTRQVILPAGCAQDALAADINHDCQALLDKLGITAISTTPDTCCGAVSAHLSAEDEARDFIRQNIDAWWPHIENGAEAILSTASACGLQIKDYGKMLADDPAYADKAIRVAELCRDVSEYLQQQDLSALPRYNNRRIAVHSPCTLQHGQGITGVIESLLQQRGYLLTHTVDPHLCCGSAGTYSILQRKLSQRLLHNKLDALSGDSPELIATANIGCLLHMRSASTVPVVHWLQLLNNENI